MKRKRFIYDYLEKKKNKINCYLYLHPDFSFDKNNLYFVISKYNKNNCTLFKQFIPELFININKEQIIINKKIKSNSKIGELVYGSLKNGFNKFRLILNNLKYSPVFIFRNNIFEDKFLKIKNSTNPLFYICHENRNLNPKFYNKNYIMKKNNIKCVCYIIMLNENKNSKFNLYKIGFTTRNIDSRFEEFFFLNLKIIYKIESNYFVLDPNYINQCCIIETLFHYMFDHYKEEINLRLDTKYRPKEMFRVPKNDISLFYRNINKIITHFKNNKLINNFQTSV